MKHWGVAIKSVLLIMIVLIAEQTFFKAKRRIAYIDEIRNEMDVKIEVYVMHPSNERWIENSKKREDIKNIEVYENQKKQMEFSNPAEGFDAIFEVIDDEIIGNVCRYV